MSHNLESFCSNIEALRVKVDSLRRNVGAFREKIPSKRVNIEALRRNVPSFREKVLSKRVNFLIVCLKAERLAVERPCEKIARKNFWGKAFTPGFFKCACVSSRHY